ncbi:MAG: CheY-P-specific phosphatase CheC [Firmicutes bacterium]|nr:CheY-P-specific phosphatase CheC [Bacillota bacterium]
MFENNLDHGKIDIIKELANIGMGNSTTALSAMLGEQKVAMDVPEVSLVALQDVPELLGGADIPVIGTYFESRGELRLVLFFVMSQPSADKVVNFLLPKETKVDTELYNSVLMEAGNIMIGAYLNALSQLTNSTLLSTPPKMAADMAGAVLGTIAAEAMIVDDQLILLKTNIKVSELEVEGSILIVPCSGSLEKMFSLLGVR